MLVWILYTWHLSLLIINKYADMVFFYTHWKSEKAEVGKSCVYSLHAVSFSTDIDIKTVVKRWCDVDKTVYRQLSGLYLQRTACV